MANNIDTLRVLDRATTMLAGKMEEFSATNRKLSSSGYCVNVLNGIVRDLNEIHNKKPPTRAEIERINNIAKQTVPRPYNDDGRSIRVPGNVDLDGRGHYSTQQDVTAEQDAFQGARVYKRYGGRSPSYEEYFQDVKKECDGLKSVRIIEPQYLTIFIDAKNNLKTFIEDTDASDQDKNEMNELLEATLKCLVVTSRPEWPKESQCTIC
jgi:hypothetical protein